MIEVIVTALIVVLIAAAVGEGLVSDADLSGYQQHRSQADEIAQQDQERLRGLSAKQLSALATPAVYSVTVANRKYQVSSQATTLSNTGASSCAAAGTGAIAYYHSVSTVTWSDVNGSHSVTEDSIITPPAGGTLRVAVVDQTTATSLPGVSVTAASTTAGGDIESGITDSNGCVLFAGLQTGDYDLSLTDPGYVAQNGNTTLTDTATLTTSGTATPTNANSQGAEIMGLAGSIAAKFAGPAVGTPYVPSLTYNGNGSVLAMANAQTVTVTSLPSTVYNLFPFAFGSGPYNYTNNYHVWAGSCTAEEPPSSDTSDEFSVTPGATLTPPAIAEPAIAINAYYGSSTLQTPTQVKLEFSSSSCNDTWTEPSTALAAGMTVLAPYASTDTSGSLQSASGQTGTLQVCVAIKPGATTYYKSVSAPNDMGFASANALSFGSKTSTGGWSTTAC
jgi:hypothetical protein